MLLMSWSSLLLLWIILGIGIVVVVGNYRMFDNASSSVGDDGSPGIVVAVVAVTVVVDVVAWIGIHSPNDRHWCRRRHRRW